MTAPDTTHLPPVDNGYGDGEPTDGWEIGDVDDSACWQTVAFMIVALGLIALYALDWLGSIA